MNEANLILPNMRGGCATVGTTVHTLFRLNNRRPGLSASRDHDDAPAQCESAGTNAERPEVPPLQMSSAKSL